MITGSFVNANSFGAGGPKPTLLLDFLTGNLDSKVTFSRGSHATYFNNSGVLTYASNNVIRNNSTTGATGATPASPGTTPTNWTATTSGTTRTISSGTIDGLDYIDIQFNGTTNAGSLSITFDTATGCPAVNLQPWALSSYVAIVGGSLSNIDAVRLAIDQRTAAGGFLVFSQSSDFKTSLTSTLAQFSYTLTTSNASTAFLQPFLKIDFNSGVNIDITLRIARPQLEIGSTVTAVNNTSGTAYYGPRFDYDPTTLEPRGLLIEGTRTNYIRNNTMQGAVAGTPGTAPTGWLYPSYAGITREIIGTGVENGINYIDIRWSGAPTSFLNGQTLVGFIGINVQTAPIGQTWNHSCYCRLIGGSFNNFDVLELGLEEWSSVGGYNGGNYKTIKTANSNPLVQQRFSESRTIQNSTTLYVSSRIDCRVQADAPIDITLRIGMPQLESYNIGTGTAGATVVSGGSGYQVGDVLEVVGGVSGTKTRLTVATLSGSAVATVTVSTAGVYYTWPTLPASVTPITGTGTSATFNLVPQQKTATTSYPVPTYTTSVTQAVDVTEVTTLTPWFNAVEGTLFCEGKTFNGAGDYPRFAALTDNQGQVETVQLILDGVNNKMQGAIWDNSVSQATWNSTNNPLTQFVKGAVAYKLNDSQAAFDGTASSIDTVCTIPTVTKLAVGMGGTGGSQINGWIKRVIYYARRLLGSELKTITN